MRAPRVQVRQGAVVWGGSVALECMVDRWQAGSKNCQGMCRCGSCSCALSSPPCVLLRAGPGGSAAGRSGRPPARPGSIASTYWREERHDRKNLLTVIDEK